MLQRRWWIPAWCTALLGSACVGTTDVATPVPPSCASGGGAAVVLAVGSYVTVDPAASKGCLRFSPNPSSVDSAEYLVVPQSATTTPNAESPFTLTGGGGAAAPPLRIVSGPGGAQTTFDGFLRHAEGAGRYGTAVHSVAPAGAVPGAPAQLIAAGTPREGSSRTFSVCPNLTCSGPYKSVTATARVVTSHLALYVDNLAPAGGLTQKDLDSLASQFEHRLYTVDTLWFGRESDIDQNGVVMVLMTPVVNRMVDSATCVQSGYIAGYFYGLDLDPTAKLDTRSNQGEVFYSLVADPAGTLSCPHPASAVKENVPVTFIHEFQHMISYNQHVLVRHGGPEVLWLNEGLSHFAEELGGRSYLPGDSATFFLYTRGDLFNGFQYLHAPALHPLVDVRGVGGLGQRGGYWLFVRYLADQFGAAITRKLDGTSLTGAANVAAQTGVPFDQTVTRWGLSLWVSGLTVPGFTPPAELTYSSWDFHSTYATLAVTYPSLFTSVYPLVPVTDAGAAVNVIDQLSAGSGYYLQALQPPGGGAFTLLLAGPGGGVLPPAVAARLSVIRIR